MFAMHTMLTSILPEYGTIEGKGGNVNKSNEFYPFLHFDFIDEWDFRKRMQPSLFPTEDTQSILNWIRSRSISKGEKSGTTSPRADGFTVKYGDFLSSYGIDSTKDSFDVIVTCFFVDTFSNVLEPLLVIQHILKPGGLWLNAGPLHFHGKSKIPYSYVQLERIISLLNFSKIFNRTIRSDYYGDGNISMKPEMYNFPLDIWKKETSKDPLLVSRESFLQKMDAKRGGDNTKKTTPTPTPTPTKSTQQSSYKEDGKFFTLM